MGPDEEADPPSPEPSPEERARARAEHARESLRLEEACDFSNAAAEALFAGDPRRALALAVLGPNKSVCERAVGLVSRTLPRDEAMRAAERLVTRGFGYWAGLIYCNLYAHLEAAPAFAAAGYSVAAARSFEHGGRPADGARILESALRARPDDAACRYELGRLLARHGRTEAAVKALQQLEPGTEHHARSLPLLRRCLITLGLDEAARTLRDEMARLGISEDAIDRDALELDASASTQGGALLLGRYETVREIATTPHARVVQARDRINGDQVAVKLLAGLDSASGRDAALRFEREARALDQLRHPNVVPLRAYHPEGPAIVLAWMPGGSLVDRLRASGDGIAPARAVEIVCGVLAALGEAHRLGILHRDVKPANVLFDDVGTARLSDFGAAHLGDLSSTATAGAIGTFAYMSPEQRLGRPASLASDLYGAGALLAEMLTGEAATPVRDRLAVLPSACHPDLGEAHDVILARLLQEDPKKRPADAFEARRLLQSIPWPERIVPREKRRSIRPPSERPGSADRLIATLEVGDGRDVAHRRHDVWLDRDVLLLPLDEPALTRARAFARAGHPVLPAVLRVDADAEAIWVAPPRGKALAEDARGLSPGHVGRLREAIEALHAAGGAHGQIDAEHLYWLDGEVTLAYPRAALAVAEAVEADQAAIARLAGG